MTAGMQDFPAVRKCPFAPPGAYERLREDEPVSRVRLPTGGSAWLVTRHEDVRRVLSSPAFSADGTRPGFPALVAGAGPILRRPPFIRMDPPQHTFHRKMLIQEFTLKRVKTMRPGIQSIVDRLVDDMLAGPNPVDLVEAFALPLPSLVICRLLGVPYDDHEFFQSRSRITAGKSSTAEEFATAMAELRGYLDALISGKQRDPDDDLLSRLVTQQLEPAGELSRSDLLGTCLLLLNAGHETTANMIGLGTAALLENPDQLAAIRSDPGLLPGAIEELLRYLSIADLITARIAAEDTDLGGTPVRAGDGVFALLAAADWDPAAFPDPARFDIRRDNRDHVAFGYGLHHCIGHNLARLELEIAFSTLLRRIPTLRAVVPVDELPYGHGRVLHGVDELPVAW